MSVVARDCVFFYGHSAGEHACLSQFAPSEFHDELGHHYSCAEQFMMASKARAMGDRQTLEAILACAYDPKRIKALGRQVSPYDEEAWAAVRLAAVARGNFLKFSQSEPLRRTLLSTRGLTLVEAAPHDRIWGIGVSVQDAARGAVWKGQNLLGQALMAVRRAIDAGEDIPPPVFAAAAASAHAERGSKEAASTAIERGEVGATAASGAEGSGVSEKHPDGQMDQPMPEVKEQH
jgi:ribA/ribD-fused uncharacterized protein